MSDHLNQVNADERLALLLERVSQQQKQGHSIDWQILHKENPDLAGELRQLLAVDQLMQGLANSSVTTIGLKSKLLTPAVSLPRSVGPYDLGEEIGRGGMGVVYKAWDRELQRVVALKMILHGPNANAADIARFRSEAQAAAGLTHPNIVPVYQVGEFEGQAFFSMKYVSGKTLANFKEKPLPSKEAAELLLAISRGVQHAHEKGILHRDLKPSNVLMDENGQPLVTDFGLAKRVEGGESITRTGAILGTPSYMAPEQAEGNSQNATPASDVYSLGSILYELITGHPPFQASSPVETLLLVRSEEPIPPKQSNPKIDTDLEMICLKCLEKRPEHRFSTAAHLAEDLQAYLNGETVSARSSSLIYFVTRIFRDTHHAPILENWGLLWIWHSIKVLGLCSVTSALYYWGVRSHWVYMSLWGFGLVVWGAIFMQFRRRGGPVTFVERQIAHAWAAGVIASIGIFIVERLLKLDVLLLSPILPVIAGMVFLVKAGTLSGWFYIAAVCSFLTAIPMALMDPGWGPVMFGIVSGLGFFVPGVKYYRQRLESNKRKG